MWAAWACVWACVGVVTGSGYQNCPPVTHYVTKYNTILQKIPVAETIYKQKIVPTTVFNKVLQTTHNTVFNKQVVPQLVTTTQYNTELKHITLVSTIVEPHDVTDYLVNENLVPQTVTETAYHTIYKTDTAYKTIRKTNLVPRVITKTDYQVQTVVDTVYKTNYQTVLLTRTVVNNDCVNNRDFANQFVPTGGFGGIGESGNAAGVGPSGIGNIGYDY